MPVDRKMPRIQAVVLPLLRARISGVDFTSWYKPVETRLYPFVTVRRLGGLAKDIDLLDEPVIELTAYTRDGIVETEDLYLDCRKVLRDAVQNQTVVPNVGYLHSFFETLGPTQFESPIEDSYRIQGLIQLGLRPPRQ